MGLGRSNRIGKRRNPELKIRQQRGRDELKSEPGRLFRRHVHRISCNIDGSPAPFRSTRMWIDVELWEVRRFCGEGYGYGYGSGLPIAWQGWVVLAAYALICGGAAPVLLIVLPNPDLYAFSALAVVRVATIVLMIICARKTQGGWRWRWGEKQ